MASAKNEAIKSLGKENDYINLSGLNTERQLANDVFNTNKTTFQNAYNDLLNTVAKNREATRVGFTQGRGTVGENAYFANRDNLATLSSRGIDKGTYDLGKLRNRMATGQQYSDLANTYYRNLDEINATETAGRNEYDYNMATAQNSLNAALADIDAREKAGRNAYKAAVAQLAEQIQSRRDANANAAAARRQAEKQANDAAVATFIDAIIKAGSYDKAVKVYNNTIGKNKNLAKLIGNPKSADAYISNWYTKPVAKNTTTKRNTSTVGSSNNALRAIATGNYSGIW
jgi:hypothetical protein